MKEKKLHPKVVALNKTQAAAAKEKRVEVLHCLARFYPAIFDTKRRIVALQKGILEDIWSDLASRGELSFSKSKLRQALVMFTRRMEYLACLKMGGKRYSLHGKPIEEITEDERVHAAQMIKKRIEKSNREKIAPSTQPNPAIRPVRSPGNHSSPQVIVKRKIQRPPVDPEAVKRLKAKLSLKKQS